MLVCWFGLVESTCGASEDNNYVWVRAVTTYETNDNCNLMFDGVLHVYVPSGHTLLRASRIEDWWRVDSGLGCLSRRKGHGD